jgi:hypothetical protein
MVPCSQENTITMVKMPKLFLGKITVAIIICFMLLYCVGIGEWVQDKIKAFASE